MQPPFPGPMPLPSLHSCCSPASIIKWLLGNTANMDDVTAGSQGLTQPGSGKEPAPSVVGALPCPREMAVGNILPASAQAAPPFVLVSQNLASDGKKGKVFIFWFLILCIKDKSEPQPQAVGRCQEPLEPSRESSGPHLVLGDLPIQSRSCN